MRVVGKLIAIGLLALPWLQADVPYEVRFVGICDTEVYEQLKRVSQLVTLNDRLPPTFTALQRRAQADHTYLIPKWISMSTRIVILLSSL